jgi:hypothetical protein
MKNRVVGVTVVIVVVHVWLRSYEEVLLLLLQVEL